jgi:GxxExxY protein
LESVYEVPLSCQLMATGLKVKNQVGISFVYEKNRFDLGFRPDIIVNDKVIIEIKSVEKMQDVHHKQSLTYLKLMNMRSGLLINSDFVSLKYDIVRIVNNL